MTNSLSGFLNINKPQGITSHDVVAQVRRGLKQRGMGKVKVGHAGTLDPMATGVLIVCLGAATRLSDDVMHGEKKYRAILKFGETTDTYDAEGQITQTRDASSLTRDQIEAALPAFRGDILQVPPMYSAIKQGGVKLYDLARAGETVEREPRPVRIDALTITDWAAPEFSLEVTCSAGTYIRSLAYDLGDQLGVGAHLAGLTRLASGQFSLADAVTLDTFLQSDEPQSYLINPRPDLMNMLGLTLDPQMENDVKHGRMLPLTDAYADGTLALASNVMGETICVLRVVSGLWKPEKVFSG